ncbi:MAG TPA: FAD-dependent oxidoreductase [Pyrinomonadaceae bacterium]|nr:FAD-dependent oxidoreductase [Pyrinomonadaceae bacterium]
MSKLTTDILIVGGGPAGMSAAVGASQKDGTKITVVDDNPHLGGQIWRADLGKIKSAEAQELIALLEQQKISILNNAAVFARTGNALHVETPSGKIEIEYKKLILATGARERFLPFPGWTLPNVFGAAGLQALVKGGLNIQDKRVVVAGTGPLLLVVAEYLASKGARIAAICEQASNKKLDRFALGLWRWPSKIAQGISLKAKLRSIPYYRNSWITAANGESLLHSVTVKRLNKTEVIECEMLACGFHLVPNTELAQLFGCSILDGFVAVDDFQETSIPNIFSAGEPTGIGGVEAAVVEGKIAGLAAIEEWDRARALFKVRHRTSTFAKALDRTFELREELKSLASSSTFVCRCEDVQYGKLTEFGDFRMAKLQTRCGMGACQGRICGAAVEFLFGWKDRSVRPPIFPVKMENL